MVTRVLLYIKHRLEFIWSIIEWTSDFIFSMLFRKRLEKILPDVIKEFTQVPYSFRKLENSDTDGLFELIGSQEGTDLNYFRPHAFDLESIETELRKTSFLMMGAFDGEKIIGYFFLRFFANRKCFVGRLIDKDYRGKRIGHTMNKIMYETAWRMKFRCLSTISRNNAAVVRAHSKNEHMIYLKELKNDYVLVEFLRKS